MEERSALAEPQRGPETRNLDEGKYVYCIIEGESEPGLTTSERLAAEPRER